MTMNTRASKFNNCGPNQLCFNIMVKKLLCCFNLKITKKKTQFCKDPTFEAWRKASEKVLEIGFYWPPLFQDYQEFVRNYDSWQHAGNLSHRNEMSKNSIQFCVVFDVYGIDFMGPFTSFDRNKYIPVAKDYVSK